LIPVGQIARVSIYLQMSTASAALFSEDWLVLVHVCGVNVGFDLQGRMFHFPELRELWT
jgi:hypothetical protein